MRKHRLYGFSLAALLAAGGLALQLSASGTQATAALTGRSMTAGSTTTTTSVGHPVRAVVHNATRNGTRGRTRSGTQQSAAHPAPATASSSLSASAQSGSPDTGATTGAGGAGGPWAELRECESGDNYAEDTGNGYYGAYQFSESTWQALGYSGLPSEAPASEQDAAAQALQARGGWSQWPSCSAQLGL